MSFVLRGFKWVSVVSPRFSPCTLPQKRIVGVTLVVVLVVVVVVIVSVGDAKKHDLCVKLGRGEEEEFITETRSTSKTVLLLFGNFIGL